MWRAILAGVVGYIVWWVIGTAGFLSLRDLWHGYAAAEPTLAFDLPMELARLSVGVLCGLGSGIVIALIARRSTFACWIVGAVILLQFLPSHYRLWARFPLWYHLFFLLTLAPLIYLGMRWALGWGARPRPDTPRPAGA